MNTNDSHYWNYVTQLLKVWTDLERTSPLSTTSASVIKVIFALSCSLWFVSLWISSLCRPALCEVQMTSDSINSISASSISAYFFSLCGPLRSNSRGPDCAYICSKVTEILQACFNITHSGTFPHMSVSPNGWRFTLNLFACSLICHMRGPDNQPSEDQW